MKTEKQCSRCKEVKLAECFYVRNDNLSSMCKLCYAEYQKENPNRKANLKRYSEKNKDKINERQRENYNKDIEKSRKYEREKRKRLRAENPEYHKEYQRKWRKENYQRLRSDPEKKLKTTLRTRFLRAVTQEYKKTSVVNLIGCSISELKTYIESLFLPGMTWENHGIFGWHIDHIIPCNAFNLKEESEQSKCFHYSNLQPLWAEDNLSKSNKLV